MNNSKNAQKRIRQKALNTARKIAATKIRLSTTKNESEKTRD